MLHSIIYENKTLKVIDQTLLPHQTCWLQIKNLEDGYRVIKNMQIRGAPLIAIVGILSFFLDVQNTSITKSDLIVKSNYLLSARPTAVNLKVAVDRFLNLVDEKMSSEAIIALLESQAEKLLQDDLEANIKLSRCGADTIEKHFKKSSKTSFNILTHCNTGSLATAGTGTALGVIKELYHRGKINMVWVPETRPWNQGSRLTVYELITDKIPHTLITDSTVASLMASGKIDLVITGADRILKNGNTANKIGTYSHAICARHHNIPFYVAASTDTIDVQSLEIPIEERPPRGFDTHPDANIYSPAFDVTRASLITGIITEKGIDYNIVRKKIGIIGGSGVNPNDLLKHGNGIVLQNESVTTKYGPPSSKLIHATIGQTEIVFIYRHGENHSIPPHKINNQANIQALLNVGCTQIIASTACGSLKEEYKIGSLVTIDQFVDRTFSNNHTYFCEDIVGHVPMGKPFSEQLRQLINNCGVELSLPMIERGTMLTIQGPRFSTKAESNVFRQWNCDLINMTTAIEASLAREKGIQYAAIAMVTDYDCWKDHEVTVPEVIKIMKVNSDNLGKLVARVLEKMVTFEVDDMSQMIQSCIVTKS